MPPTTAFGLLDSTRVETLGKGSGFYFGGGNSTPDNTLPSPTYALRGEEGVQVRPPRCPPAAPSPRRRAQRRGGRRESVARAGGGSGNHAGADAPARRVTGPPRPGGHWDPPHSSGAGVGGGAGPIAWEGEPGSRKISHKIKFYSKITK